MSGPIRGKVARVLNSRQIAISIGSKDGVKIDMYFDVMDPRGEDIEDPDTGEILGSIERSKVRIKITKVQENLSVGSTYRKTRENIGGQLTSDMGSFAKLLMPPEWITKYETLKTEEKTWEDLDEDQSYVKIGDPVVQIIKMIDSD